MQAAPASADRAVGGVAPVGAAGERRCGYPTNMDYPPARWPQSPRTVVQCGSLSIKTALITSVLCATGGEKQAGSVCHMLAPPPDADGGSWASAGRSVPPQRPAATIDAVRDDSYDSTTSRAGCLRPYAQPFAGQHAVHGRVHGCTAVYSRPHSSERHTPWMHTARTGSRTCSVSGLPAPRLEIVSRRLCLHNKQAAAPRLVEQALTQWSRGALQALHRGVPSCPACRGAASHWRVLPF